jgi:hypothetical protein
MNQPRIFSESGWSQSWIELAVLYSLVMVGATIVLDMHWLVAMSVTPVLMLGFLLAVLVAVQVLWLVVIGLEKLGTAAGLRKSPLS